MDRHPCPTDDQEFHLAYLSSEVAHFELRTKPGHPTMSHYDLDREEWDRCGHPSTLHVHLTFGAF